MTQRVIEPAHYDRHCGNERPWEHRHQAQQSLRQNLLSVWKSILTAPSMCPPANSAGVRISTTTSSVFSLSKCDNSLGSIITASVAAAITTSTELFACFFSQPMTPKIATITIAQYLIVRICQSYRFLAIGITRWKKRSLEQK